MGEEQRVELLPVNPAVKRGHGAMKHEVGRLSSAPVALPYLASRVPPDIHVAIVDENVDEINFEKQVDLVGISVLTMSAPRAYEIAALYTVDYYKDTIKRITDHGISVLAGFVFGFDTDDESVFERTVEFAIESKLLYADFNILCPYPGTAVRAKLTEECRIIETDWSKYFGMYNVVFRPKRMSVEALQEGCLWAWKEFYSSSRSSQDRCHDRISPPGSIPWHILSYMPQRTEGSPSLAEMDMGVLAASLDLDLWTIRRFPLYHC